MAFAARLSVSIVSVGVRATGDAEDALSVKTVGQPAVTPAVTGTAAAGVYVVVTGVSAAVDVCVVVDCGCDSVGGVAAVRTAVVGVVRPSVPVSVATGGADSVAGAVGGADSVAGAVGGADSVAGAVGGADSSAGTVGGVDSAAGTVGGVDSAAGTMRSADSGAATASAAPPVTAFDCGAAADA